jgi:hypothetical protein
MVPGARAKCLDSANAESQEVRGRRGQLGVPKRELLRRATGVLAGPISGKTAQQTIPLFKDAPVPGKRAQIWATRLADGDVQISPARTGSSRDKIYVLRRKVNGRELPDGVDRAHRSFVESNHLLERALTSFTESDADLDLMNTVTPLEFSPQTGIWRNRQINTAVPVRDFTLCRRARRASRGEHRDRLEDRRFSAGIGADSAKPARVDRQYELPERAELVQLEGTQTHVGYCRKGVSGRR